MSVRMSGIFANMEMDDGKMSQSSRFAERHFDSHAAGSKGKVAHQATCIMRKS
jgi:hypothetical protein